MTASCYFHLCFSELTAQHLVVKYVHYVQICTSWFTSSGNTAPMWCSEVESKGVQAQSVTLMQEAHQNKLYAQFRDLCIPQCLNKRVSGWCAHLVWVYMYTNPTWAFCLYFSQCHGFICFKCFTGTLSCLRVWKSYLASSDSQNNYITHALYMSSHQEVRES